MVGGRAGFPSLTLSPLPQRPTSTYHHPMKIDFTSELWRWTAKKTAAWFFVTLTEEATSDLRFAIQGLSRNNIGTVKVEVTVGGSVWQTSLFPNKDDSEFWLPIKAQVRKTENLVEGRPVVCSIRLVDP